MSAVHPVELLEYYVKDSQSDLILTTPEFEEKMRPLADKLKKPLHIVDPKKLIMPEEASFDEDTLISNFPKGSFYKTSPALVLYTSGTTSKPKGTSFFCSIKLFFYYKLETL